MGSSDFGDVMTGKMTEIGDMWYKDGVTTVLVDVPHGYYYFGVKSIRIPNTNQLFRLNIQQAPKQNNKSIIPNTLYSINWNQKSSITTTFK